MAEFKKKEVLLEKKLLTIFAVYQIILIFAPSNVRDMSYTREPIVIDNPSEKLLKTIKKLREHKLAELEKLRNMKPEEFSRRVILA